MLKSAPVDLMTFAYSWMFALMSLFGVGSILLFYKRKNQDAETGEMLLKLQDLEDV